MRCALWGGRTAPPGLFVRYVNSLTAGAPVTCHAMANLTEIQSEEIEALRSIYTEGELEVYLRLALPPLAPARVPVLSYPLPACAQPLPPSCALLCPHASSPLRIPAPPSLSSCLTLHCAPALPVPCHVSLPPFPPQLTSPLALQCCSHSAISITEIR